MLTILPERTVVLVLAELEVLGALHSRRRFAMTLQRISQLISACLHLSAVCDSLSAEAHLCRIALEVLIAQEPGLETLFTVPWS